MNKVSEILLKVFAAGVILSLFAGAVALLGFIVAMFVGGETATEMCVFIHKQYFPYVIKFTSVFVGFGLIGMYLSKIKALSLAEEKNSAEDNT